ncbi:PrsW family glutamic-type intramembrane protease [Microbacterium sp. zg.B48]|uniref:PrsW family intramembrane metalloprotease n=1 Tax=unclassified Microbacterium TaxID=2609290 RepID=UPI00214B0541|nr:MULTISPECIES: PrsW family glutamic-type intramembrane protease [unclassified Microbacterium]MCR2764790.1 PrsW family glutamic-type intramembrane protease [Microbacterium sp. zg.B48]MCR2810072.1 PrsW family glutamic-type intramembrane protease [Microbacterium sp. zg.B185]WIM20090.1 PrsW family glutamic-type intramembrane protease [Microbacterium sp. zg-B185]
MTNPPGPFDARTPSARPSLTPPAFASPLAQPRVAPGASIPVATASPAVVPVPPRKGRTAPVWISGILVLILVGLVGYFLNAIGPGASIIGMILAFVPLVAVLLAVRIIDRWEPEPKGLLLFAVAWGAIAAVGITLGVDILITMILGADDSQIRDAFAAVVQAPLVEEFAKGLGVYLIFLTARRAFDGPIDGVVYGALVGAGFAFTENIQYFAISLIEGGVGDVSVTFFVRGILSPFAHVMFTSVTGFALGLAARRGARGGRAAGPWVLGVLGATALHALWNGSAVFGDFFALYLTLQVPLFVGFILGIIALRREEARLTRARLGDYATAGWFTPQEVDMLATAPGRRAALAWARTLRGDRTAIMKEFISDATALAAARQRAISGRDADAREDEHVLLARTRAARAAMFAP